MVYFLLVALCLRLSWRPKMDGLVTASGVNVDNDTKNIVERFGVKTFFGMSMKLFNLKSLSK